MARNLNIRVAEKAKIPALLKISARSVDPLRKIHKIIIPLGRHFRGMPQLIPARIFNRPGSGGRWRRYDTAGDIRAKGLGGVIVAVDMHLKTELFHQLAKFPG